MSANAHRIPLLRGKVKRKENTLFLVTTGEGKCVRLSTEGSDHLQASARLLQVGMPLCAVDSDLLSDGSLRPTFLILHPDYLVDASTLAACFKECGPSAYYYLLNRFAQKDTSPYILRGHMANQSLEACIHYEQPSFEQVREACQRDFPLDFKATTGLGEAFYKECEQQFEHIRRVVEAQKLKGRSLLETSFFCPALGLQGRFDLLTSDTHQLIELKSGKKDEFRDMAKEEHAIQALLYREMLHYAHGTPREGVRAQVLYAKYPALIDADATSQGVGARNAEQRLGEALTLRNQIILLESLLCKGEGMHLIDQLFAEKLRTRPGGASDKFWLQWAKPSIEKTLLPLQQMTKEQKAHFNELLTFVAREQWLAMDGSLPHLPQADEHSQSALWRISAHEKQASGDLIAPLFITHRRTNADGLTEALILRRGFPSYNNNGSSSDAADTSSGHANFRRGDTVILYPKTNEKDDATNQRILRLSIEDITPDLLTLRLRQPQPLPDLGKMPFALEHDVTHATFGPLYRGLGIYARHGLPSPNEQPLRLVVGPPGSGKTRNEMKKIAQSAGKHCAMLFAAFTNRAVDEICQMLHNLDPVPDYIRMGRDTACDPRYISHLLQPSDADHLDGRLIVSTVSTLLATPSLLKLTRFDLAVFDEASQLLEPLLLPLLCHRQPDGKPTLASVVLIGDDKQLPAVVVQQTDSPAKESLFHHLLRLPQPPPTTFLERQGRMHPDIAAFSNTHFYGGRLRSLGLSHQTEPLYPTLASSHDKGRLAHERMLFVDVPTPTPLPPFKSNPAEAEVIARIVKEVRRLGEEAGVHYTIGIIVPYRRQIACVWHTLLRRGLSVEKEEDLLIDTVERFQGGERDIILYGLTISRKDEWENLSVLTPTPEGPVDRKLNVALTRARRQFILVGSSHLLDCNPLYQDLRRTCTPLA